MLLCCSVLITVDFAFGGFLQFKLRILEAVLLTAH
jgi:hypothetical protein